MPLDTPRPFGFSHIKKIVSVANIKLVSKCFKLVAFKRTATAARHHGNATAQTLCIFWQIKYTDNTIVFFFPKLRLFGALAGEAGAAGDRAGGNSGYRCGKNTRGPLVTVALVP